MKSKQDQMIEIMKRAGGSRDGTRCHPRSEVVRSEASPQCSPEVEAGLMLFRSAAVPGLNLFFRAYSFKEKKEDHDEKLMKRAI